MAEFCLECFNKYISDKIYTEKEVVLDDDLCEECGEWKPCVVIIKEKNPFKRFLEWTYITPTIKRIEVKFYLRNLRRERLRKEQIKQKSSSK